MIDNEIFTKGAKIHFIGIGGISMSALARILMNDGCTVSGSDMNASHITKDLEEHGAKIFIGHSADNITDQRLVVYTAAVKEDNPEFVRAKELGIEIIDRAELLGTIMKRYSVPIAVSGTHGKTSTTGMLSQIFIEAGSDPTITIGGELDTIGGNLRVGSKEIFIAEACEYHRSFLKFSPKITIILNVEADHLDYYKDLDDIIDAFHSLVLKTPSDGAVIVNADDVNTPNVIFGADKKIVTVGIKNNADYMAYNISHDDFDRCHFSVKKNGEFVTEVSLSVPGEHNVYNALFAITAADLSGVSIESAAESVQNFTGVHRRFEKKGTFSGASVIDDYAHHPSEIKATLTAARELHYKNIWCVFQPHTYTRTKTLFDDFVSVLSQSEANVIITDIYAAREKDTGLVSSKELSEKIPNSVYIKEFSDVEQYLKEKVSSGDMIITMGAGDVYKIGESLVKSEGMK